MRRRTSTARSSAGTVEPRPDGVFYRIVPGGYFPSSTTAPDAEVGNLHLGIFDAGQRPPAPRSGRRRATARRQRLGAGARLDPRRRRRQRGPTSSKRAEANGATILWRDHYWAEFNGYNGAFLDPWGNTIILWSKGGDDPTPRSDQTTGTRE